jgi:ATP-dependent Clp protease ATP-binding subunit ClpC
VLGSLGITLDDVRSRVTADIGVGASVESSLIPFTPRGKKVLELALREARSLGHDHVETEHVLLGIVRETKGVAARILLDGGASAERVRAEVAGQLDERG